MSNLILLAQMVAPTTAAAPGTSVLPAAGTTSVTAAAASQPAASPGLFGIPPLLLFAVPLILVYMLLFRGKGKEEKKRKAMIDQLKRGDEVMTIGGLIGTVVDVRGERVIIKVDESNNVKETYLKSAIQKVVEPSDLKA